MPFPTGERYEPCAALRLRIRTPVAEENRTRTIQLPGLPEAMSQMALPMVAHGLLGEFSL